MGHMTLSPWAKMEVWFSIFWQEQKLKELTKSYFAQKILQKNYAYQEKGGLDTPKKDQIYLITFYMYSYTNSSITETFWTYTILSVCGVQQGGE